MLLGLNPLGKYPLGDIGSDGSSIPALVVTGAVQISVLASGYAEFSIVPTISIHGSVEYLPSAYGMGFVEIGASGGVSVLPEITASFAHGISGSGSLNVSPLANGKVLGSLMQGVASYKPVATGLSRVNLTIQGAVKPLPVVAGSLTHSAGTSTGITGAVSVSPAVSGMIGQGRAASGSVSVTPKCVSAFGAGGYLQGSVLAMPSAKGRAQFSRVYVKPGALRGACVYSAHTNAALRHGVSIAGDARPVPVIRLSRIPPTGGHVRFSPSVAGLLVFDSPAVASGALVYLPSVSGDGYAGLSAGHLIGNSVPAKPIVQGTIHV